MKNINRHITVGAINTEFTIIDDNEKFENYLTIEALEDGLTAKLSTNACQYSTDGVVWNDLAAGTTTPTINTGDKLYFKATGLTPVSGTGIGTFTVNKNFNLSGNCNSMLFGDDAKTNLDLTGYNYAFNNLFSNCTTLQLVSRTFLPATTLTSYCYQLIFYGCTSLTSAPELPATTLAAQCYSQMFRDCTALTTAPSVLPATTTYTSCCERMFMGCTALTEAPELPATRMATGCYSAMFRDCTSLTTVSVLSATVMYSRCCQYMFERCTSLTTAPELPATTLASECYRYMFNGCSKLNYIKMLATNISASGCLSSWVSGVSSTGTFVKNVNATWTTTGTSGIPSGWTVETAIA